jgi:hypothetical protein
LLDCACGSLANEGCARVDKHVVREIQLHVEAEWRIVEPILASAGQPHEYEPGSGTGGSRPTDGSPRSPAQAHARAAERVAVKRRDETLAIPRASLPRSLQKRRRPRRFRPSRP